MRCDTDIVGPTFGDRAFAAAGPGLRITEQSSMFHSIAPERGGLIVRTIDSGGR